MSDLQTDLGKLAEKLEGGREDHLKEVVSMQKTLKKALLKKNLKEHPALHQLLQTLTKREQGYRLILANKREMTSEDRNIMFARADEIKFVLNFFNIDPVLEGVEKYVEYQLSDAVEGVDNA